MVQLTLPHLGFKESGADSCDCWLLTASLLPHLKVKYNFISSSAKTLRHLESGADSFKETASLLPQLKVRCILVLQLTYRLSYLGFDVSGEVSTISFFPHLKTITNSS